MKKTILLSMVAATFTFASSYTNSEEILKDTFDTNFKCTPIEGCVGSNISINNATVKNMRIVLGENFKLNYSKKSILKKAKSICGKNKECILKVSISEESKKVKNIFTQSKRVELDNVLLSTPDNEYEVSISEVIIENNSPLHRIDLDNLTIDDLLINSKITLNGLTSTKLRDIVTHLKSVLPKSNKVKYDKKEDKLVKVNNPIINDINNKFITMYSTLFSNTKMSTVSDVVLSINSTEKDKVLFTKLRINVNDSLSGKSNLEVDLKLRDAVEKIGKFSEASGLAIVMTLLSNVIIDRVDFKNNQEMLVLKHKTKLVSDPSYKKNYIELLSLIDETAKDLSLYNRFGYKLLSLKYVDSSLAIKNKNEMKTIQFMNVISTIENKDFFEVVESYK